MAVVDDTSMLHLADLLRGIAMELSSSEAVAEAFSGSVGHAELGDQLMFFNRSWAEGRDNIAEALVNLSNHVATALQTTQDLDSSTAKELQ